ncbi:MAG: SHOCT domain-containing protein [Bacteroidetes bacterium]|nr:MAG: SHOCT domain-containing protein [Bacteroidota bacterium]
MSTALNIVLAQAGDNLNVEIGAGQWLDKVAGGTVGMLLLWPLAVTTVIGSWNQSQMPAKVFNFIGNFVGQQKAAPKTQAAAPEDDLISKLERLSALREKGILTEEEFQAQKAKILAEG